MRWLVDLEGSAGGKVAGEQGDGDEGERDGDEDQRVGRFDPKSTPASSRVAAKAAGRPIATPIRAIAKLRLVTKRKMSCAAAPSATRRPISCVRWLTE